jgi:hypothetical protein
MREHTHVGMNVGIYASHPSILGSAYACMRMRVVCEELWTLLNMWTYRFAFPIQVCAHVHSCIRVQNATSHTQVAIVYMCVVVETMARAHTRTAHLDAKATHAHHVPNHSYTKTLLHTHHSHAYRSRFTHGAGPAHLVLRDATVWMVPRDKTVRPAREDLPVSRVLPDPREPKAGPAPQDLREPGELPEIRDPRACPVRVAPLERR